MQERRAIERRASLGARWSTELTTLGAGAAPYLAQDLTGRAYVVEGAAKRRVPSGILAAALEDVLGAPRQLSDTELGSMSDGPPVELFEEPAGKNFVVVGGERFDVRGIPQTYPVEVDAARKFPKAGSINAAKANVPRRRLNQVMGLRFQLDRIRGAVRRRGIGGTAKAVAGRAGRVVRRPSAR